jgi:hypothetical protein
MRSKAGIAMVSSCMIMEALMYGEIPIAKIVNWLKELPVSRSRKPRISYCETASFKRAVFTPGIGIKQPSR